MTSEMQLHNETIELLCGHAAEKRLRASSAGGWTRMVSRRESVAHHESGHAVAAFALLGKTVHLLSIEQDHTIVVARRGWTAGGHCLATKSTEAPVRTGTVEIEPDSRRALRNCILLSRAFGALAYRRHYRRLQNEALKFCNDYWPVIHEIALKLQFRGRMNREEVHEILARTELFPSVPWTPPIWAPMPCETRIQ
jgi:hypothetical protein